MPGAETEDKTVVVTAGLQELKMFSFRIAAVGQIRIELVFGADSKTSIAFIARMLHVIIGCRGSAAIKPQDREKGEEDSYPPAPVIERANKIKKRRSLA